MKTLILTCNTGQGHNSSAASIKDVFESNGHICEIADAISFLSKQASKIVEKCFTGIYRHIPKAFDSMYVYSDSHVGPLNATDSAVKVLKLGCKRLYNYIIENEFDSIICVHLFPAIMITWLKEKHSLKAKTALLSTDYTCYPFTEKTDMDLYFLPHIDLADEFSRVVNSRARLVATGIPVKKAFLSAPDKSDAKAILGLAQDSKVIFIMGGSMGCGPMEDLVENISRTADKTTRLLVSCGTNEKLLKNLRKKELINAEIFSFSDNIPVIMSAADLFVTKPGGISSTEAGVSGLPTIIIDAVGGCETPNYNFFVNHNYFYGAESTDEVSELCHSLLSNPKKLEERARILKQVFCKDSGTEIYKAMSEEN